MTSIITAIIFALTVFVVKTIIQINGLLLLVSKDIDLVKTPNALEKDYQFVKGLY